jgi:hypothetical protein
MNTVPLLDLYPTVLGQGPRSGEPVVLARVDFPPGIKYARLEPTIQTGKVPEMLTVSDLMTRVVAFGLSWFFIGGEDPAALDLERICKEAHYSGIKVMIDSTGLFKIPYEVDYLSLGPKPGLPCDPLAIRRADDLRFYLEPREKELWVGTIDRVLNGEHYNGCTAWIMPRRLDKDNIDAVISYVLSKKSEKIRADFPMYRMVPDFDSSFNAGKVGSVIYQSPNESVGK